MPLLSIWQSNPTAISAFSIEQIVSAAGNGDLRDNSECSTELRIYLSEITVERLASYLDYCLSHAFQRSGWVLQDIVNELGRRLDYNVQHGRYQGTINAIGYDGLWMAPERNSLIIEVKTTDAYRISLDKLAGYRRELMRTNQAPAESSILIITGRDDTGELEAQIRGSRHAWDIRLISVDALLKLVSIKQNTEGRDTAEKIRRLLVPVEFTRLDGLIDVIFTTARDVETTAQVEAVGLRDDEEGQQEESASGYEFTDTAELNAKRNELLASLTAKLGANLIKHSRALFQNAAHDVRVAVTMSKRYTKKGQLPYWYAYHPHWDSFLAEARQAFLVLGCMDKRAAYVLPLDTIREQLAKLNTTTTRDGKHYYHIKLSEGTDGSVALQLPKASRSMPIEQFRLPVEKGETQ
jgi:hypothetical protein